MYKLLSLELSGYRRMMLDEIRHFKVTFNSHLQLVLGPNGVGKSAFLKEATALPPSGTEFFKDGFKIVTVLGGDNRVYTLTSSFHTQSGKHSFMTDDGVELNEGGTSTVQKELVRKHFGITPEIQAIVSGREAFHNMDKSKRREWLTIFSDVSYDYAISVYDKVSQRYRDNEGFLRLAKKRLAEETAKLISPDEEARIQEEVDEISRDLEILQKNRAPFNHGDEERAESKLRDQLEEIDSISRAIERRAIVGEKAAAIGDTVAIENKIIQLTKDIAINETAVTESMGEYNSLVETRDILIKAGKEGVEELGVKLNSLRLLRDDTLSKRSLKLEGFGEDPRNALSALKTIYGTLEQTLSDIPANGDGRYSKSGLEELHKKLFSAREREQMLQAKQRGLLTKKSHIEEHLKTGEQQCPACNHRWVKGFNKDDHESVISALETTATEIKETEEVIASLLEEVAAYDSYRALYGAYINCARAWTVLTPFWGYLAEKQLVIREPRTALSSLAHFLNDLEIEVRAFEVSEEIRRTITLIEQAKAVGNASLDDVEEKIRQIEIKIERAHGIVVSSTAELTYYRQLQKDLLDLSARGEALRAAIKEAGSLNKLQIEMARRATIEKGIRSLQITLARRSEVLQTHLRQKDLIEDLKGQIEKALEVKEASAALMDELSPAKGLIAEGLMGFIKVFVAKMNAVIRRIWSYHLEIKPCGTSDSGSAMLDYKFPLAVGRPDNVVSDVSLGSSGMYEIIDLAFRVVAMRYLNIVQTPFYLDEFGKALDTQHRVNTINMINTIVETEKFSQLFIVSHDYSQYGAFTAAEICVLSENNIVTPDVYNQHVQFFKE